MRLGILVATSLIALTPAASLEAQRPLSVGLAGGVSLPQGDLSEGASTGWHAIGTLWLSTLMQPMGLRIDVAHNRFAFSDEVQTALGADGDQTTTSATANVTYRLPSAGKPISPYLITGIGAYRIGCSIDPGCDSSTHYGWNVGFGSRLYLLGLRSFVEARYHRTGRDGGDVHFFPITFGVLF